MNARGIRPDRRPDDGGPGAGGRLRGLAVAVTLAGLAAVTQDAEDVLSTDLGRAVIANSATQILLRQAPQAIGKVADEFDNVHSIERAHQVGSVQAIVPPARLRSYLIDAVRRGMQRALAR